MQAGSVVRLNAIIATQLQNPVDQLYTVESVHQDENFCVLIGSPYKFPIDQVIEVTEYEPVLQHIKMKVIKTTEHTIVGSYMLGTVPPFELSNCVTLSVEETDVRYEPINIVQNVTTEVLNASSKL